MKGGAWGVALMLLVVALAAVLVKPGASTSSVLKAGGTAGGQLLSAAEGNG